MPQLSETDRVVNAHLSVRPNTYFFLSFPLPFTHTYYFLALFILLLPFHFFLLQAYGLGTIEEAKEIWKWDRIRIIRTFFPMSIGKMDFR